MTKNAKPPVPIDNSTPEPSLNERLKKKPRDSVNLESPTKMDIDSVKISLSFENTSSDKHTKPDHTNNNNALPSTLTSPKDPNYNNNLPNDDDDDSCQETTDPNLPTLTATTTNNNKEKIIQHDLAPKYTHIWKNPINPTNNQWKVDSTNNEFKNAQPYLRTDLSKALKNTSRSRKTY